MADAHPPEVAAVYGSWESTTPDDAARLMANYPGTWWIAGGWAIEHFTGRSRPHGDLDISIPRPDVRLLQQHLVASFHLWQADCGTLRPFLSLKESLSPTCSNIWLRENGDSPWTLDVILMSIDDDLWTYKRHPGISKPLTDILMTDNGRRYLRPEVQLLHKAPGLRPKDQADFDACLPRLSTGAVSWLLGALETAHPGHPWIAALVNR